MHILFTKHLYISVEQAFSHVTWPTICLSLQLLKVGTCPSRWSFHLLEHSITKIDSLVPKKTLVCFETWAYTWNELLTPIRTAIRTGFSLNSLGTSLEVKSLLCQVLYKPQKGELCGYVPVLAPPWENRPVWPEHLPQPKTLLSLPDLPKPGTWWWQMIYRRPRGLDTKFNHFSSPWVSSALSDLSGSLCTITIIIICCSLPATFADIELLNRNMLSLYLSWGDAEIVRT